MKTIIVKVFAALSITGVLAGSALCGCSGGVVSQACEQLCICEQCTDADRTACEEDGDKARQQADSAGCGSQFDAAVGCFADNLSCHDSGAANDACATQIDAFDSCTKEGGIFNLGDDCTRATDHLVQCLNVTESGSGGTKVECAGSTLCSALCINAADCAAIKDAFSGMPTDASKSFLDCATKCAS